jgi:hypothetical protein
MLGDKTTKVNKKAGKETKNKLSRLDVISA